MSTRRDGMPQGHPESQPIVLATLILQASGDPTRGDLQVSGDLRINGAIAKGTPEEVADEVRELMRGVLGTDNTVVIATPCTCAACSARAAGQGGDSR